MYLGSSAIAAASRGSALTESVTTERIGFLAHCGQWVPTRPSLDRSPMSDAGTDRRIEPCPFRYAQQLRIGGATWSRCSVAGATILRGAGAAYS
jgi:hypothetical protein